MRQFSPRLEKLQLVESRRTFARFFLLEISADDKIKELWHCCSLIYGFTFNILVGINRKSNEFRDASWLWLPSHLIALHMSLFLFHCRHFINRLLLPPSHAEVGKLCLLSWCVRYKQSVSFNPTELLSDLSSNTVAAPVQLESPVEKPLLRAGNGNCTGTVLSQFEKDLLITFLQEL